MIVVLILLIILSILMLIFGCGCAYMAYRAGIAFLAAEEQKEQYHSYMKLMLDRLQDHSEIFRTALARKMGLDFPETREMNALLQQLETTVVSMRSNLTQFLNE